MPSITSGRQAQATNISNLLSHMGSFTGQLGENIAAEYLQSKKYQIRHRNYKIRYGEIDIIAEIGKTIVFVEVKTRSSSVYGLPVDAITPWKLQALIKTSNFYVATQRLENRQLRMDVISVLLTENGDPTIEHIENITG